MKVCILEANLEGQGWYSKLFTILLILTWELRYLEKGGFTEKEGEFRKLFCLGGEKMTHLGKEGFAWETRGRGNYRLTIK